MAKKNWTTEITPLMGRVISLLREKEGLRVKDLARKANVGVKSIQRIQNLKEKQAFNTSDLHRLAQTLGTTSNELLGEFSDWLPKDDDYVSVNLMFECVKNMELTPLFRVYDSTWSRHQLVSSWDEAQNLISSGVQYEGVEGLVSVEKVGQGVPLFQIPEGFPNEMSNYFLATEEPTSTSVPSTFLGWAFSNSNPLFWASLVRLEHLKLFTTPTAKVKDNIYTIGHDFISKEGYLELSEIDLAADYGFRLIRTHNGEFWILDRIFLGPIFRFGDTLYICWSRLSTAESYQLEVRFNQGRWQQIHHGSENEFSYTPQTSGQYEFRVKPLLKNRESVTLAKSNDRKGLEERFSCVRAINFSHSSLDEDNVVSKRKFHHSWQFRSSMFNWRHEGWEEFCYQKRLSSTGGIIQNSDGTITIDDRVRGANLTIVHRIGWEPPFTVQVRLKINEIGGISSKTREEKQGFLPKVSCFIRGELGIQFVLDLDEITTWYCRSAYPVDTAVFHVYTIVVNEDGRGDVYVDDNFASPALMLQPDEAMFIPGSRLEIGSPTHCVSKMTIDYVCYTQGVVLALACMPDWVWVTKRDL